MTDTERPPRSSRRRSARPPQPEDTPPKEQPKVDAKPPGKPIGTLQKKLEQFFVGLSLPFAAAGDMHCAGILAERGPVVAEAWATLAAEKPQVKKVLEAMLSGGAWAGAITSTLALVVAIGSHHGLPVPDVGQLVASRVKRQPPEEEEGELAELFQMPPASQNGAETPTAPGPAAVSLPEHDDNLTDPTKYAGPHNDTAG